MVAGLRKYVIIRGVHRYWWIALCYTFGLRLRQVLLSVELTLVFFPDSFLCCTCLSLLLVLPDFFLWSSFYLYYMLLNLPCNNERLDLSTRRPKKRRGGQLASLCLRLMGLLVGCHISPVLSLQSSSVMLFTFSQAVIEWVNAVLCRILHDIVMTDSSNK